MQEWRGCGSLWVVAACPRGWLEKWSWGLADFSWGAELGLEFCQRRSALPGFAHGEKPVLGYWNVAFMRRNLSWIFRECFSLDTSWKLAWLSAAKMATSTPLNRAILSLRCDCNLGSGLKV